MPKPSTFPTLFDECLQLSVTYLKRKGYLKPNQCKSGLVTWSSNGNTAGSISLMVNTQSETPFLELKYTCAGTLKNYSIRLVSIPSNLKKGMVWFFVCPHTGKRCRKLYFKAGMFLHREAFKGMYSRQARSKSWLKWQKLFEAEAILKQQEKPYFRTHYNGKPTKRYLSLLKKAERVQQISNADLIPSK